MLNNGLNYDSAYWLDLTVRLGLAMLAGALIGINRDFHHRSIGLRTLGLVALASCMLVLSVSQYAQQHGNGGYDAVSRVTQGIVSGIGFLGAGVILRAPDQVHVLGITTAATILVVAALGIACALAAWPILLLGFAGTIILLIACGPLEKAIQRAIERRDASTGKPL